MSILYGTYRTMTGALFAASFPPLWLYSRLTGRFQSHLNERLGLIPVEVKREFEGFPRIWMHAVSLGEVHVAAAIIDALRDMMPGCAMVLSTMTEHGRALAEAFSKDEFPVIYAPIDVFFSVRKALAALNPHVMVFLETEIWPSWIKEARGMGIKTALINGRISLKSISGYLRFRPFFRDVLSDVDLFSMISEADADRIVAIGADPHKIKVHGNAKYDLLGRRADPAIKSQIRKVLRISPAQRVIVAGSTRRGEEGMVLDAYGKIVKAFPDTILVIAPRHIKRTPQICASLAMRRLGYQLWTELGTGRKRRKEQIVILNTFGDLFKVYSVASIVFCGGSLVPLGGQNPMEPAAWGKIVLYGPSMENFLEAKSLLEETGAGMEVSSADTLAEKALGLLMDRRVLEEKGVRAREAALKNWGAAQKHACMIKELIGRWESP